MDIMYRGQNVQTVGALPEVGSPAPDFTLVGPDLEDIVASDFSGRRIVLNIFPSIDTGVCATAARKFNQIADQLPNTTVICVSRDLPFALNRFCAVEGIENVVTASAFRSTFGEDYGVAMANGPIATLLSRSVVVIDEEGTVVYTEQVPNTSDEPNYEKATQAVMSA
ncbi:thiol peroxidase [Flaviflexus huanghaiensis]|uniref:thiol peroxidase n=1 Tax=Flaviflexus huanghaiensis TaxID=1111473 RepID=UPI0015FCA0FF|nr:thiol peroxidase [Flaviflexus huanghaiensis]